MEALAFRQLCAIARSAFTDPGMSDSEWADAVKVKIARGGWDYPLPERLTAALRAVERTLDRVSVVSTVPTRVELHGQPYPLSRHECVEAYRELKSRFEASHGKVSRNNEPSS